jgi:hypothetical protein
MISKLWKPNANVFIIGYPCELYNSFCERRNKTDEEVYVNELTNNIQNLICIDTTHCILYIQFHLFQVHHGG